MSHSNRVDSRASKGLTDSFILIFTLKGHNLYRLESCGRELAIAQAKYEQLKDKIETFRIVRFDGLTGELHEMAI